MCEGEKGRGRVVGMEKKLARVRMPVMREGKYPKRKGVELEFQWMMGI